MWTKRNFNSEKELNIYIKNIEKLIRGSLEYKEWLQHIRTLGGWKCKISNVTLEQASIEIHHTPYTLYDLVEIIIYNQSENFCTFSIAQQIMSLHFNDLVGWVSLTKTIHEQVHNENIILPFNILTGNFSKFEYLYSIPIDITERINYRIEKMKKENNIL